MGSAQVRVEQVGDGVALITIDRADRLNALDSAMVGELSSVLTQVSEDGAVRAVVLTGAGDKAFVAGGDVTEMRDLELDEADRFVYTGQELTRQIERLPQPVLAAINGYALGGGAEIALACDIRVASEHAIFGFPEVTLGILPGWGGTQRAVRLLGRGLALELVLTGRRVSADEALRIGLVNRVVPATELLAATFELAGAIAKNSPIAVRQAKKAIQRGADVALDQGMTIEAEAWRHLITHPDRREGLSALLEKRAPRWRS